MTVIFTLFLYEAKIAGHVHGIVNARQDREEDCQKCVIRVWYLPIARAVMPERRHIYTGNAYN